MRFVNIAIFIGFFLLVSCYHEPAVKIQAQDKSKIVPSKTQPELGPGVLIYKGRQSIPPDEEPKIQIENLDGSIFKELDVLNDTSLISDFYPLVMFLEHDLLAFEVVRIQNQLYSVKLFGDKEEMIKRINAGKNKMLRFMSWEDYFLNADVLLDLPQSVQIYHEPNENGKKIKQKVDVEIDEFTIKAMKGYWMKVEVNHFLNDEYGDEEVFEGWIKWRNKSELLVEIGFLD